VKSGGKENDGEETLDLERAWIQLAVEVAGTDEEEWPRSAVKAVSTGIPFEKKVNVCDERFRVECDLQNTARGQLRDHTKRGAIDLRNKSTQDRIPCIRSHYTIVATLMTEDASAFERGDLCSCKLEQVTDVFSIASRHKALPSLPPE
jgi:hypothetical protein